jgi:hypothetical protein
MIVRHSILRRAGAAVLSLTLLLQGAGCGNPFLGLEDYQRDILFNGLLFYLLQRDNQNDTGNDGSGDPPAGQPIPGPEGPQGPEGPAGAQGVQGEAGTPGAAGPRGAQGPKGETGVIGPAGPAGANGATGPAGPPGEGGTFLDVFIDDFFTYANSILGELDTGIVNITEPALGAANPESGDSGAIAYRFEVPEIYDGEELTMRLMFFRTGPTEPGQCLIFSIDTLRLRDGQGIGPYGDRLWIRVDRPAPETTQKSAAEFLLGGEPEGQYLVLELPLNSPAGLGYPDDLNVTDLIAFEIATETRNDDLSPWDDGGRYELLGVEFYESTGATLKGVTIFESEEALTCEDEGKG